jgi:hypothetical protein
MVLADAGNMLRTSTGRTNAANFPNRIALNISGPFIDRSAIKQPKS